MLADLWRYAEAAYHEPMGLSFIPPTDRLHFYHWQDDTDFCFCSVEGGRVVVSHRGTDDLKGWISDLKLIDRINDTIDPGIHDGFGEYGRKWLEEIALIIIEAKRQGKKVFLTGHSRGSAAAGARCYFLAKKYSVNVDSVIGFGTANWCDKPIRNEVNALPTDFTNVNTSYDIVQTLPPIMVRPGKEYTLKTSFFCPWPPIPPMAFARGVRDHLQETYRHLLIDNA
jgi:hypothetical protein